MSDRSAEIETFLHRAGWGEARRRPLAGDASNRRYERLAHPETGAPAVLMDAPPERGESVDAFIRIARHLTRIGLSAPKLLAEDAGAGLLLLEDLGDDLFSRVVRRAPAMEPELYAAAMDTLAALHAAPPPKGVATYTPAAMTEVAARAYDWYRIGAGGSADPGDRAAFCGEIETLLRAGAPARPVLILRDCHAENLIWLPDRTGPARVGLLDFQDAMLAHSAYDVVSVLLDARRDVPPALADAMRARFATAAGHDAEAFEAAFALLGAQRSLGIVGVFARLAMRDGKPHYVDLIPRVWDQLCRCLRHPALASLARRIETDLPPPTPETLQRLKERCATVPTP